MKRLGIILGTILVALGISAVPAYAYPADCTSSAYICFYDTTSAGGTEAQDSSTLYTQSVCYTADSIQKVTSYIANPTSWRFNVYLTTNCTGAVGPIYAHSTGPMNSTWSNKIRSIAKIGQI